MYPLGFINPDDGLAAIDQAVQMVEHATTRYFWHAHNCCPPGRLVFDNWSQKDAERCARAGDAAPSGDPARIRTSRLPTLRSDTKGKYREALQISKPAWRELITARR
jgi:hypothetical protein